MKIKRLSKVHGIIVFFASIFILGLILLWIYIDQSMTTTDDDFKKSHPSVYVK